MDEVGEAQIAYVFMRTTQWRRIASFVGTFVSVALASVHLGLPLVVGGGCTVLLGIYLLIAMPETGFQPTAKGSYNPLQQINSLFKESLQVVSRGTILRWFLVLDPNQNETPSFGPRASH